MGIVTGNAGNRTFREAVTLIESKTGEDAFVAGDAGGRGVVDPGEACRGGCRRVPGAGMRSMTVGAGHIGTAVLCEPSTRMLGGMARRTGFNIGAHN